MAQAASTYLGEQRRRSTRVEQTTAVIIRGVDLLDQPFEERAAAQNLSFHGCCYASKHHLPKNTWVTLEVPSSESLGEAACVRARVAWIQRPQTLRDLFQVGVELERGRNVWGVTLPPADWTSSAFRPDSSAQQKRAESSSDEASLETYLQLAFAHANKEPERVIDASQFSQGEGTLLGQLRQELLALSDLEAMSNMRRGSEGPRANEKVSHAKRIEELEHGKLDAREEIAAVLMQNVQAHLVTFEKQVRSTLMSEWVVKLSHAQVTRSDWEAEMHALRGEMQSVAEASEKRSEEKLREEVNEIRREWSSSLAGSTETGTATGEPVRNRLLEEMETARTQWNELLESSLDSAARRLSDRLGSGSQEIARHTERELATKIAKMRKESEFAEETGRAVLSELKGALEGEVSKAKIALQEIEETTGRLSEYSRQLEAASQDSLNDLRQRLESSMVRQCAEFDRHAAEMERGLGGRVNVSLEQISVEAVTRGIEQIGRAVAAGLASAAKATEELAAREEQAEGILRIHRERLRQVSEQVQREEAANLASQLDMLQEDLEKLRWQNLTQWNAELAAERGRAAEQAAATLAKEAEERLAEVDAQLLSQSQRAIESAQEQLQKELLILAGKFQGELREIEASQVADTRETLALEAHERLGSAKNEFIRATELAVSAFVELIQKSGEKALETFSAASEARAEDGRARLLAVGENVLAGIQSHAQSSFEHFQEQLGIKAEQALQRANETLAHQFEAALERLRTHGEARLADWAVKQESISAQMLEKHTAQLHQAANSWVEMTLERLDSRSEERVDSAVRTAENAVREACVDIFENLTQVLKRQLQGTLEIRPAAPGEIDTQEHRASA